MASNKDQAGDHPKNEGSSLDGDERMHRFLQNNLAYSPFLFHVDGGGVESNPSEREEAIMQSNIDLEVQANAAARAKELADERYKKVAVDERYWY